MAELRRRCPQCKRQFRPRKGSPRRYCESCRPPRVRGGVVEGVPIGPVVDDRKPGPLEVACLAELERVDRVTTIEGVALLAVARDADRLEGTPQRAGVLERLLKLKAAALVGTAPAEVDRVDELAAARAARIASA